MPATEGHRRGTPQSRHAHGALVRGLETVEGHFPGLTAALVGQGAGYGDVGLNARSFHEGDRHRPAASGCCAINVGRPLMEAAVRARLLELPSFQIVAGCDALGLLSTPDPARVSGVAGNAPDIIGIAPTEQSGGEGNPLASAKSGAGRLHRWDQ